MKSLVSALLLLCCFLMNDANAEIFRWVDDDGNVHFSDKKPEESSNQIDVEDISDKLSEINIDESSESLRKLDQVLSESVGEKQLRKKQENREQQNKQRREQACGQARRHLRKLRGRVSFIDEDGNEFDISEQQRKREAAKFEAEIKQHCA